MDHTLKSYRGLDGLFDGLKNIPPPNLEKFKHEFKHNTFQEDDVKATASEFKNNL